MRLDYQSDLSRTNKALSKLLDASPNTLCVWLKVWGMVVLE
jgi:hypothetical protein